MKEMLNLKNPKIYAEMFLSRMPKNTKRILMYGISDKRTIEIILDSFQEAEFVVADHEANNNLLKHFYEEGKQFKYINTSDDEKDLTLFNEKGEIGKMPKFDVAIMNPPYDKGLHLRILNEIKNNTDEIYNISPIQKYQEYFIHNGFNNDELKKLNETHKIDFLTYFDCDYSCNFFGLSSLGSDTGIWKITKRNKFNEENNKKEIEKNLTKIVPHYNLVKKIITKFNESNLETLNEYLTESPEKYSIKFVYGLTLKNNGGHGFSAFSCTSRNQDTAFENSGESSHIRYVNASTQKHRINIWKSYTTKFMRFYQKCVMLGNADYSKIPYMIDYENAWTEKDFCHYFDITGYISDTEAVNGSEWEIILNTMKEHN